MNFADAVAARRSIRSFLDRQVPRELVDRAIELAQLAPAPHHSRPWGFVLIEDKADRTMLAKVMGDAWLEDLEADGLPSEKAQALVARSHQLLTGAPLLIVCTADLAKAHDYPDERRRLAEWSLFAHSTGAALQTLMVSLADAGIGSCWLSAPVFCRATVREHLSLGETVEPQALVLVGYPDPEYSPRPRPGIAQGMG
jgi:coenzyme F420-0:L-glutamate ligase / coenzyme F420-1:gamma-L-glutamate ligase